MLTLSERLIFKHDADRLWQGNTTSNAKGKRVLPEGGRGIPCRRKDAGIVGKRG